MLDWNMTQMSFFWKDSHNDTFVSELFNYNIQLCNKYLGMYSQYNLLYNDHKVAVLPWFKHVNL